MPAAATTHTADILVVGWGLAGLVAASEAVAAGKRVIIVDQEPRTNLGGQAWWSFGGLFFVDSPEQRRMGDHGLARSRTPGLVRHRRLRPRRGCLAPAVGRGLPAVRAPARSAPGCVRRASGSSPSSDGPSAAATRAIGPGNSVPRFHITWGTGPGIVAPFQAEVEAGEAQGRVTILAPPSRRRAHRRRDGTVVGRDAATSSRRPAPRAASRSSARSSATFEITAAATIVSSGGIGGNHDLVRAELARPPRHAPRTMLTGVPAYVDGSMLAITENAGARLINGDRMWHYVEGIQNWDPVWPDHGIRILPGPSSLWLDATGKRLPVPLFPGFDTLGTLAHLRATGHDHSLVRAHAEDHREGVHALRQRAEPRPDRQGRAAARQDAPRQGRGAVRSRRSRTRAPTSSCATRSPSSSRACRRCPAATCSTPSAFGCEVEARDREIDNDFTKDAQIADAASARDYRGDKLIRVATPHRILDPKAGPLIAVKLHVLTRKSLGGIETDLVRAGARTRRRADPRAVRGRRGERLRRRRRARLPRARGHVRRRLPLLRTHRGTRGRRGRVAKGSGEDLGDRSPGSRSGCGRRRSPRSR